MTTSLPNEDELLAAELAFGLLDATERQLAENRLDRDADFADAHARWQAYAAALFSDRGEAPQPWVWDAIEARLPANEIAPAASAKSPRWWQAGTAAASAAAIVLGLLALQKPQTVIVRVPVLQAPAPPLVAVLTGKTGSATISFDPASGRITSAANGLDIGHHSPELWVLPADGKPRSMGVIDASAPAWLKVPAEASSALKPGVAIAISVEPLKGSTTGQPTGPVILIGKLARI